MSYFAVENLSLRFGGLHALRGLSFAVEKGEIFAVIGPNGAGKTSLFNVVTRVFSPTEGRVVFKGTDITGLPRHRVVAQGIARTFQNIELFEGESVLENLMLGRHRFPQGNPFSQICRLPSVRRADEEARAAVEDIIELLDLAPYRHLPVSGLPYGVRKVVELARALATGPELLLLDEPASGLNPEETRDLAFWIEDIRRDLGITIVMIEHDMSLVSETADRVLCMNMGEVLAVGTAGEVQSHPDVVAAYLGS
jgi:branched-chain amino acid transport system ATP-binding protein